jgi:hypothetical protein
MRNKNGLQLVILPGKNPPSYLAEKYESAYTCWKKTWEDAARELQDMPHSLDSTEFIRQDEVLAVFHGSECTSLGFWTELDFSFIPSREDFYFRKWTDEAFRALVRDGKMVGKYSYLTVAKKYRKESEYSISFKNLQIAIFVLRFLNSRAQSMTATTRNNKGVNNVCRDGGAVLINENLSLYGVNIDLMVWYKNTAVLPASVKEVAEELWKNRIDFKNTTIPMTEEVPYDPAIAHRSA